jgi:hypothetical protein
MNISSRQMEFFEFLCSLDRNQLEKYFLMLGPIESEYIRQLAIKIGTQLTLDLNLELAELLDGVEDLADAKLVLNDFTLSGKAK